MNKRKKLEERGKQKLVHVCDYCEKEFYRPSDLKHVAVQTGQKDYHCSFCDYSTSYKSALTIHIRHHLNERPFKCQEPNCGASFTDPSNLKRQQFVRNKNDKKFLCTLCTFKTHLKGHLSRHMKNIYSNLRPFKCPHENCEHSAKRKGDLNRHLKIHSEEKIKICPHPNCGFKTKTSRYLKNHMEIHSTGEKRYKCRLCDFSSHHHGSLVRHIRRHTGERPFACQLCDYKSKNKTNLTKHMKIHTDSKTS